MAQKSRSTKRIESGVAIEANRAEPQSNPWEERLLCQHKDQAEHDSRGRAEHLPAGVRLSQENVMGRAEHQHSQVGVLHEMGQAEQKPEGNHEQRCRDDTSSRSSLTTQSVRQSPTTQGAVAWYVGVSIGNYLVTNLTNTNLGTT